MNFGMPGMPEHDLRYDMADEYMDVVRGLWGSWEPGAIIADRKSGNLIDHTKVHGVNYAGKYFQTRGPLNSGPSPQGRPVIAQAGGSPRGRRFAAAHADTIVVNAKGIDAMRAYRDDVHKHMVAQGRKPSDCKVLYLINPILGETMEEALERKKKRESMAQANIQERLAHFGKVTNIDFGKFDLDKPLPDDVTTNGHQLNLEQFRALANGRSIRKTMASFNAVDLSIDLCGTCDFGGRHAWARSCRRSAATGSSSPCPTSTAAPWPKIEDGLVPALQDRGLVRKAYEHKQFRDNLLAY